MNVMVVDFITLYQHIFLCSLSWEKAACIKYYYKNMEHKNKINASSKGKKEKEKEPASSSSLFNCSSFIKCSPQHTKKRHRSCSSQHSLLTISWRQLSGRIWRENTRGEQTEYQKMQYLNCDCVAGVTIMMIHYVVNQQFCLLIKYYFK